VRTIATLAALLAVAPAWAAPKVESLTAQPNQPKLAGGKTPEVEVAVSVNRGRFDKGNCDVRLDFGDGEGRTLDFGVATKRSVRHVYKRTGTFIVGVGGTGATPCQGTQQTVVVVTAGPEAKKTEHKKKAPAKKAPAKKGEKKKDETQ
jgi:hypothetical protein